MPRRNYSQKITPHDRVHFVRQPSTHRDVRCHATGKRRYGTKALAERAAAANPDTELSVYRCDHCRAWHLTSR